MTGARAAAAVVRGARKVAGLALEIGEHPIAALLAKAVELLAEESLVVHGSSPVALLAPGARARCSRRRVSRAGVHGTRSLGCRLPNSSA